MSHPFTQYIKVRGARENNLQSIDVDIPKCSLVVVTGVSGSGKSSLAFDTLFAEGQRRYVESLSPYARLFIEQASRPRVDSIEGIPPSIAVEHRVGTSNPRSTVGTVTGIYDHLRLLYAHLGRLFCPSCGREITSHSVDEIVDLVLSLGEPGEDGTGSGARVQLMAPLVRGAKGEHKKVLQLAVRQGFFRVVVDGTMHDLDNGLPRLSRNDCHDIDVVIDRFRVTDDERGRLAEGIELAMKMADGLVTVDAGEYGRFLYSSRSACPDCELSFPEISPRSFSFNSPVGACPECQGIGRVYRVDGELILPPSERCSLEDMIFRWSSLLGRRSLMGLFKELNRRCIGTSLPVRELSEADRQWVLLGTKDDGGEVFPGLVNLMTQRYKRIRQGQVKETLKRYIGEQVCPGCVGHRLRCESLAVKFRGRNIAELTGDSVRALGSFFAEVELTARDVEMCGLVVVEIKSRLDFLQKVGLGYISLDREVGTLSGGEFQRIRLAGQLGSQLTGVLYVLDEPSVGLHPLDQRNLLLTLRELRDLGNTVLVVEHDRDTILTADHIIDLGPAAGKQGGRVMYTGALEGLSRAPDSVTARYLEKPAGARGEPLVSQPPRRGYLRLVGAREHNLNDITVEFPLGLLTCVTGVSGSGKSTLVLDTLYCALARSLNQGHAGRPGKHEYIEGDSGIDRVIVVDARPIGRTSRSNPATYSTVFTDIRALFSRTVQARERAFGPGRFSFNVRGGRCEACEGEGVCRVEMQFMPDVFVTCEVCRGLRYNRETLEVKYRGLNIAEILSMTISESLRFFQDIPKIRRKLEVLRQVGLGYLELGQPAPSLSAGEVQRMKLSRELTRRSTGRTVYILDEPTTGLHFADIEVLLGVLKSLVDRGETVIIVEHNLDVVLAADWVVDLGPGGGIEGGNLLGAGSPETIAGLPGSVTGQFIGEALK